MLRLVFSSFRTSIKQGQPLFDFVHYFACLGPILMLQKAPSVGFTPMITLILSLLLTSILPNRLTKGMYLCPTTAEQRSSFIRLSIRVKLIGFDSIYLLGMLITSYFLTVPLLYTLIGLIYYTEGLFLNNIIAFGVVPIKNKHLSNEITIFMKRYRPAKERYFSMLLMFVSFLGFIIFFYGPVNYNWILSLHAVLLLVNTSFLLLYMKLYYNKLIALNVNYEAIYESQFMKR